MMTKLIPMLCLFLIPLTLFAVDTKAPVELSLKSDGREWVLIRDDDIDGQGIVEFMLAAEDKSNWSEVVTLQYFWSETLDPKQLFDLFITNIEKQAGAADVTKTIIEEKDKDIMAEWEIKNSPNDQYEIIRIIGDGKVVAVIRYTAKLERMSQEKIDVWKKIIQNAHLK